MVHLDDLLLRRVRLGLLTSEGAWPIIGRIRAIVQPELGWDDARWEAEAQRYRQLWQRYYGVPEGWEAAAIALTPEPRVELQEPRSWRGMYLGLALLLALLGLLWRRRAKDKA